MHLMIVWWCMLVNRVDSSIDLVKNRYYEKNSLRFGQKESNDKSISRDNLVLACSAGLVGFGGLAGVIISKKKTSCAAKIFDTEFKNNLQKALQNEGVNVSLSSLESIVGPEEFCQLVKKFKPSHFRAGLQTSKSDIPLEKFYENAINGEFRVSLHTHSNFSDGKAAPEEFLECARKYADKVAKLNKNDKLPPFTIALTDHDCIEGTKEIIKLIAQNPKRYKNLKFVAGCEFSVKNNGRYHDITGLALNPFDKGLRDMLNNLKEARKKTIQCFLDSKQNGSDTKITIEDLINYEKQYYNSKGKDGKRTMENGSGVVYIRHAIKYFYKLINKPINKSELNQLDSKDILPVEQVVNTINKNGGLASLTHPLKSFWSYIGDRELLKLKQMGVKGIEVNHQYTPSKILKLEKLSGQGENNTDKVYKDLTEQYRNFAARNDMFLSGGTDCHEKQIFSREPKITQDLLQNRILK